MNAEQRILAWLETADFDGTGCRWSQERIGEACGCSRRTVIRATKKLADEGHIDSWLERRPGCKWPCRVYRVKHWNPHKRSGVLNVLGAIREARKTQCHTERTAKPSRAQATPVNPSLTASSWRAKRCGREHASSQTELRRTNRMEAQPRRLQAVPNPSFDATPLLAELERKDQIIKTLQFELNKAMEGEAEWREAAKAAGRASIAAKGQAARRAKAAATAAQVNAVIDCWMVHRPRTRREESFPEGGKRWEMIEKALALVADAENGPVEALKEAIEGLHLCPYLVYGKRAATGKPSDLRVRPEDLFRDEVYLDRARSAYRWAKALPQERAWSLYELSRSFSESWWRTAADALKALPEEPEDDTFEVDGIVVSHETGSVDEAAAE